MTTPATAWGNLSQPAAVGPMPVPYERTLRTPMRLFDVATFGAVGDGVTDDRAAWQAAINAAGAAGGGRVTGAGVSIISSPLIVNADMVEIEGTSQGTILRAAFGFTGAALIQYQAPAGAFRYGCRIAHLAIDGNAQAGLAAGIELDSVRHALVEHVEMLRCPNVNLFFNGVAGFFSAYNSVQSCSFHDSYGGTGIKLNDAEWCSIGGCSFVLFNTAGGYGIHCLGGLNTSIVGNLFDACDTAVFLDFANYCSVTGNQFDEGGATFISLKSAQCNSISGNTFNQRTGSGTDLIHCDLFGGNRSNVFANNVAQSGNTWVNFVQEVQTGGGNGGVGNLYVNNVTGGYGVILITGITRNNVDYNPVLTITPPAVPATTVALTNPNSFDVTVYITGGTVSAIAIGGHATGLTSGSFHLPAGVTITLTYTAAPTWVWIGE